MDYQTVLSLGNQIDLLGQRNCRFDPFGRFKYNPYDCKIVDLGGMETKLSSQISFRGKNNAELFTLEENKTVLSGQQNCR